VIFGRLALESTACRHFARPSPSILVIASTLYTPNSGTQRAAHDEQPEYTAIPPLASYWSPSSPDAGLLALSLNGSSNEAMYQSIQQNGLRACEEIPIAQQASCKAQYQKDSATYNRERDSLKAS
jgi:hypothetical protein